MKMIKKILPFLLILITQSTILAQSPYSGTIFIDPTIITAADPTTFVSSTYTGQGTRTVYDRRVNAFININAYLFNIVWSDGITSEAQINPEFGSIAAASAEATKYGTIVGRLPACLRVDVDALWIHKGVQPFGGGNRSILIHTGQSALYEADGILEETLVHEAAHTSLDAAHAAAAGWLSAQASDAKFISTYAADNPTREDIAESFLTWLAIRQATIRISQLNVTKITQAIPNRISYFDSKSFNMFPLLMFNPLPIHLTSFEGQCTDNKTTLLQWTTQQETESSHFEIEKSTNGKTFVVIGKIESSHYSSAEKTYNFMDTHTATTHYYRLKHVDMDNKWTYSKVITVKCGLENKIEILPNPTSDAITIKGLAKATRIDFINAAGQNVLSKTNYTEGGEIDVSRLPKGMYYLQITNEDKLNKQTAKFFKRE